MKTFLRGFPFTLTMLELLGLTAILTNTHLATISARWLDRLGFAPRDLLKLEPGFLFTSALVSSGERAFGVHLATLVIESLAIALPMRWIEMTLGSLVSLSRDVGLSAGYFDALGLFSAHLKYPWNLISSGLIFIGLQMTLLNTSRSNNLGIEVSADLAHPIAFPPGWFSSKILEVGMVQKETKRLTS
jgi:hypothetical protein